MACLLRHHAQLNVLHITQPRKGPYFPTLSGREEVWIKIQADTFKNWVNVNLAETGKKVVDFEDDLRDGTKLVALVETLQKRKLRHNKRPQNQHHELENLSIALDAIKEDGIKLVNIGKTA